MIFHSLYLEGFIQKSYKKALKLTLLLKFIYILPFDHDLGGGGGGAYFFLLQTLFM